MILGLASIAATGCASSDPSASATPPAPAAAYVYDSNAAAALAFDPPQALGRPMPSFDRDGRAMAAFAGYEQAVTTLSHTHQRDEIRVRTDSGVLERRAYTDRTSITTR